MYVYEEYATRGNLYAGDRLDDDNYSTHGPDGFGLLIGDVVTWATGGLVGNESVAFLGSTDVDMLVTDVQGESVSVIVRVSNSSSVSSATHVPGTFWSPFHDKQTGTYHTVEQLILWQVTVNLRQGQEWYYQDVAAQNAQEMGAAMALLGSLG